MKKLCSTLWPKLMIRHLIHPKSFWFFQKSWRLSKNQTRFFLFSDILWRHEGFNEKGGKRQRNRVSWFVSTHFSLSLSSFFLFCCCREGSLERWLHNLLLRTASCHVSIEWTTSSFRFFPELHSRSKRSNSDTKRNKNVIKSYDWKYLTSNSTSM